MFLIFYLILQSRNQMVGSLYGWESIVVSRHPAKCSGPGHISVRDTMFLVRREQESRTQFNLALLLSLKYIT